MIALPVLLPHGFSPIVNEGDTVTSGQPIAQKTTKQEEVINIAQLLALSPSRVRKVLKKNPGDAVNVGDTIALKKSFFGLDTSAVISRVEGIVSRYERHTGNLAIRTSFGVGANTEKIISPVAGVVALCNNEKIVINTEKNVIVGTGGNGNSGEGEIFVLEASLHETAPDKLLYSVDTEAIGKVILGRNLTRESIIKGIGIGALGIIGIGIQPEDLEHVAQKRLMTPVIAIDEEGMNKLLTWHGKKVYMDPAAKSIILLEL